VYHLERIVEWQTAGGKWEERYLDATFQYMKHLATIETELEVRLQGQKYAKRQTVSVDFRPFPSEFTIPKRRTAPNRSG
jgi:hypothetical protein